MKTTLQKKMWFLEKWYFHENTPQLTWLRNFTSHRFDLHSKCRIWRKFWCCRNSHAWTMARTLPHHPQDLRRPNAVIPPIPFIHHPFFLPSCPVSPNPTFPSTWRTFMCCWLLSSKLPLFFPPLLISSLSVLDLQNFSDKNTHELLLEAGQREQRAPC